MTFTKQYLLWRTSGCAVPPLYPPCGCEISPLVSGRVGTDSVNQVLNVFFRVRAGAEQVPTCPRMSVGEAKIFANETVYFGLQWTQTDWVGPEVTLRHARTAGCAPLRARISRSFGRWM